MGELALYLLAQAVGTLGFAYAQGTVAFKQRALPAFMAAAGLYALMGAALVEVGADRFGWSATSLGLDYALVTIGVAAVGSGSLLKNLDTGLGWTRERLVAPFGENGYELARDERILEKDLLLVFRPS